MRAEWEIQMRLKAMKDVNYPSEMITLLEWVLKKPFGLSKKDCIFRGATDATIKAAQERLHNEMGNLPED